jgi:hypothetical protein
VLVGLHCSPLIVDVVETGVIAAVTFGSSMLRKHFTDVDDAALYGGASSVVVRRPWLSFVPRSARGVFLVPIVSRRTFWR